MWTHWFVTEPLVAQESHSCLGTPQIRIPRYSKLRSGFVILGWDPLFAAGYVLAYDWSSETTDMCNPVQNQVVGCVWGQHGQTATHYECIIPTLAQLNSNQKSLKRMYHTSNVSNGSCRNGTALDRQFVYGFMDRCQWFWQLRVLIRFSSASACSFIWCGCFCCSITAYDQNRSTTMQ